MRITGAKDDQHKHQTKDKFGGKIWKYAIGCEYDFDIKNPLKYPVKIAAFRFVVGKWSNSFLYFNKLIPAGKTTRVRSNSVFAHRFETKEPIVDKNRWASLFKKYGCKAQIGSGKAILSARNKVEFPPEAGIAAKDAYKFLTTSQTGFVPLYNDFPK